MTPERLEKIRAVLNRRQADLTVINDEVHKGRNLAAIMRTCDAVGIDHMHVVEPKDGYRSYRGTASGSNKWVEVSTYDSVSAAIREVKSRGMKVVAAHLDDRAVDYRSIDYCEPTALLMGMEREGVSEEALALADETVVIPMMGMVESFNVSVAAAIILSEAQRQRDARGMYEECRLNGALYKRRFFQWAHPQVARFCEEKGLDYPEVGLDGEIIDGPGWYHQKAREG
ncbi:tRNA (guanosine(18)-2'-O)-methyltransferase TrmH [Pseudoteredinibacter isoporae]|uniref:tRNA (guanosine(18)-2'-O)-methyltransferase n=1 Tax=Pseudoteredinibacter isoporae TaxID=570281 RepID=A0A7X0JSZ5_9GAMM|nr:tRNA (guanosine(18)-2'-O)-methyltransferase TrmH [Pseudoteredinibacter isoporae]MBB6521587.1 tRNA (guanosine-2'-O-)-methyltransferase [Pseudoteredinibacter isoporae]NHO87141.1 tRNA (guanosine(18)-2'-O)-methyltransferase TrmH [Pseudoteredinibacter isoporae]NIB22965.1 tRNA (guanosine(18)-2'-O)-methyltransferase TrmH [Pseudoteredinibacter isoporae]